MVPFGRPDMFSFSKIADDVYTVCLTIQANAFGHWILSSVLIMFTVILDLHFQKIFELGM